MVIYDIITNYIIKYYDVSYILVCESIYTIVNTSIIMYLNQIKYIFLIYKLVYLCIRIVYTHNKHLYIIFIIFICLIVI